MSSGLRYYVQSPYNFAESRAGAGIDMCEHFVHLAGGGGRAVRVPRLPRPSRWTTRPRSTTSTRGTSSAAIPAVGSWVTYGLGSENQNLPGYIVLAEAGFPQGGSGNWSNGFLPAYYQGTPLRAEGSPILDIQPQAVEDPRTSARQPGHAGGTEPRPSSASIPST